ncbi:LETM1 domain-containing protein 1 isoform 3-T3 [Amazona ochrocephala]
MTGRAAFPSANQLSVFRVTSVPPVSRQDGAAHGRLPGAALAPRARPQPRAGGAEVPRALPLHEGRLQVRPGRAHLHGEAHQQEVREVPGARVPPVLCAPLHVHQRWVLGGARDVLPHRGRGFPGHRTLRLLRASPGIRALFLEVKEIRDIRSRMARQRLSVQQLPYRDMERLRQFRRDLIKAVPIGIIAIPPFANFLVIFLMYFFPRQLLIRHFWTPQQQIEFLDTYDVIRRGSYPAVLQSLAQAARSLPDPQLRSRLQQLCSQVQCGSQPRVAELCAVRAAFSASALALNHLHVSHVKALSRVLFLSPHLPGPVLRHRLRSHVLEIRQLDRALQRLSPGQLREEELRAVRSPPGSARSLHPKPCPGAECPPHALQACYLRGLNSTHLDVASCRAWLEQWLGLSCRLEGDGGRGAAPAWWGWAGSWGRSGGSCGMSSGFIPVWASSLRRMQRNVLPLPMAVPVWSTPRDSPGLGGPVPQRPQGGRFQPWGE